MPTFRQSHPSDSSFPGKHSLTSAGFPPPRHHMSQGATCSLSLPSVTVSPVILATVHVSRAKRKLSPKLHSVEGGYFAVEMQLQAALSCKGRTPHMRLTAKGLRGTGSAPLSGVPAEERAPLL